MTEVRITEMDDTSACHDVAHTAKATCNSEPSHVSTLVQDWCADARKVKHFERAHVA